MEHMSQAIPDRCGIDGETTRQAPVYVKEDRSLIHFRAYVFQKVFTDYFKQRMAWRNPIVGGQFLEDFFVEDDLFVFSSQLSESWFQPLSDGPKMTRHAGHSVCVLSFTLLTHFNASHRSRLKKEILDHFRDETALDRKSTLLN